MTGDGDGAVLEPARVADHLAIQDLATAYAHAVDDGDWPRWEALFTPDALIDYTAAGGIAGTPAEIFDVSAVYEDSYRRVGGSWRINRRVERTVGLTGGRFAEAIRSSIADDGR